MTTKRALGLLLSVCLGSAATARDGAPARDLDTGQAAHSVSAGVTHTTSGSRVGSGVLAQAPDAAAARDELTLWSRVRDSNNPAEIEAFLAAFPNGRLAPLARARLNELRKPQESPGVGPAAGVAPNVDTTDGPTSRPPQNRPNAPSGPRIDFNPSAILPPSPPTPSAGPLIGGSPGSLAPELRPNAPASVTPVAHTAGVVAEVQERLFNLNYNPGPINGRMDQTTIAAITRFQQQFSLPPTGQIDEGVLKRLRDAKIPSEWAALAFHARGAYSAVWLRPSRRQAEQEAMAECQRRARGNCTLAAAAGTQCIGLANASGRRNRSFQAFSYLASSLNDARGGVIEYCRRESAFPDACEVRTSVCADGSHNR